MESDDSSTIKIKVLVRIAPPSISQIFSESAISSSNESSKKNDPSKISAIAIQPTDDYSLRTTNPKENIRNKEKDYTFDRIFDATATQEIVYKALSSQVLESLEGHNVNIFAYGATAAGKTFTMHGNTLNPGIIPQALKDLFEKMESLKSEDDSHHFHVEVSFIELYNNNFRNLLSGKTKKALLKVSKHESSMSSIVDDIDGDTNASVAPVPLDFTDASDSSSLTVPPPVPAASESSRTPFAPHEVEKIEIHESEILGVFLSGDIRVTVNSLEEALFLLHRGEKLRSSRTVTKPNTAEGTELSYSASRSHSIFTVYVESHHINSNRKGADSALKSQLRLGKLNFIDLAGTERQDAQGRHKVVHSPEMTEMHNINLSLTALGDVLFAISEQSRHKVSQKKRSYGSIPYRNSKLTHFMKESFGGNAVTVMVANLHSTADFYPLTTTTLTYASWAANTHNIVKENLIVDFSDLSKEGDDLEAHRLSKRIFDRSKTLRLDAAQLQFSSDSSTKDEEEVVGEEIPVEAEVEPTSSAILDLEEKESEAGESTSCLTCLELQAKLTALEIQIREANADFDLKQGLLRRLAAQLKEKEAEEERKVLTKLENDHTAEQKLAELKVLYSQLTIDIEAHRASHRNTFFAENIEVEAEEPTSSTPLISAGNAANYGSSGDGQTVPLAQPEAAPKKTLLQKLCCCCGGN